MTAKIKKSQTPALILKIALIGLFLLQVYSYLKADWVTSATIGSSTTLLYKFAYSNKVMELVRYCLLLLIVLVSVLIVKHNRLSWVYIYILAAFAVVYCAV